MTARKLRNARPAAAAILAVSAIVSGGASLAQPAPAAAVDKAQEAFETACSNCHDISIVTDARYDRSGWQNVINRMQTHGFSTTNEEKKKLIDYLCAHYSDADKPC